MACPRTRARPSLQITRGFERSRLDELLLAAAYELAAPVVRRLLPQPASAGRKGKTDKVDRNPSRANGGLGA
jgi:hypothetical protein